MVGCLVLGTPFLCTSHVPPNADACLLLLRVLLARRSALAHASGSRYGRIVPTH